jgi:hypothetical protein
VGHIAALLSKLEDPFELFPIQAVTSDLSRAVDESEGFLIDSGGPWGVSAKFRTVEDEHHIDKIALLIGSAFVVGQVAITQSVAISRRIRELADQPSWLPSNRTEIMGLEAPIHLATGLAEVVLVDAVANYFKHHYEWPPDWITTNRHQRQTIEVVRRLGLSPGAGENLYTAVRSLGFTTSELHRLGENLQVWRERLAAFLRRETASHGLVG